MLQLTGIGGCRAIRYIPPGCRQTPANDCWNPAAGCGKFAGCRLNGWLRWRYQGPGYRSLRLRLQLVLRPLQRLAACSDELVVQCLQVLILEFTWLQIFGRIVNPVTLEQRKNSVCMREFAGGNVAEDGQFPTTIQEYIDVVSQFFLFAHVNKIFDLLIANRDGGCGCT